LSHRKELGNAAWKVLHTTFARFPDKPTKDESQALDTYIHLFQRLYPWYVHLAITPIKMYMTTYTLTRTHSYTPAHSLPHSLTHPLGVNRANHACSGECAEHFGRLIAKFPPQTSSRSAAAAWGCHVHNEVNKKLKKPLFDCANIGDFYDCGCADKDEDDPKSGKKSDENKKPVSEDAKPKGQDKQTEKPMEKAAAAGGRSTKEEGPLKLEKEG
jgi:FAD-linked sulfhydryl oxidase